MKRLSIIIILSLLLTGCSSTNVRKIDDKLLNHFSSSDQALLQEVNPDVVTMEYLVKHSKDYACELDTDRNDFFVLMHGTITDISIRSYDEEEVRALLPADMADTLLASTVADVYIDGCADSIRVDIDEFPVETGAEYYFFVHVSESFEGYSYNAFQVFDFN